MFFAHLPSEQGAGQSPSINLECKCVNLPFYNFPHHTSNIQPKDITPQNQEFFHLREVEELVRAKETLRDVRAGILVIVELRLKCTLSYLL